MISIEPCCKSLLYIFAYILVFSFSQFFFFSFASRQQKINQLFGKQLQAEIDIFNNFFYVQSFRIVRPLFLKYLQNEIVEFRLYVFRYKYIEKLFLASYLYSGHSMDSSDRRKNAKIAYLYLWVIEVTFIVITMIIISYHILLS